MAEQLSLFDDLEGADEIAVSGVQKRAKPGDIFILGDHRLMCGDSTDWGCIKKLSGGGTG